MKKFTLLVILITVFLFGADTTLFAQNEEKPCKTCPSGTSSLTPDEAKLLRENYKPIIQRSNLVQPANWTENKKTESTPENKLKSVAILTETVYDSQGTEFWLTMMRNYNTYNPTLYLDITCPEDASGTVEISGIGFSEAFTVSANTITRVNLPANTMVANEEVVNKGIHVLADKEVTVYGMNRIPYTTDAYLGLPVDILSTQYMAMTYTGYNGSTFAPEFAIVSPYDNNLIHITPKSNTEGGHFAGTTYDVTLNAGEVYQVIGTGDLTGSVIQSTLPVAFFSGNSCTNIPAGYGYCDHIVEQIPPYTTWGTTFVTYPLQGRLHGDTWRFLATQDNTTLIINGSVVATLNFGDFYETVLESSAYITSTNPILSAQFANGNTWDPETDNNGDPFMMIIPPYQQFMTDYTFATPSEGFNTNYANVTVESVGIPFQYLDNIIVLPESFNPISTSTFSGGSLPITIGTHSSHNTNANLFGIYNYGFNADDSYGYAGGVSLTSIASKTGPVIALTPETILLNSTSQSTGTPLVITAVILDAVEPFVQSAILYYRHSGDVTFQSVTMTKGSGDIWSANIPAGTVLFPGVQYYIYATDGQLSATSPVIDPSNNPYSVAVGNEPPLIIHDPVTVAFIGQNVPIGAQVTDVTESLQSVQLFYRVAGGNPVYSMLEMDNTSGSLFEAVIPGLQMTAQGVEYYIRATDNYGVISTSGTADVPHFITGTVVIPQGSEELSFRFANPRIHQVSGVDHFEFDVQMKADIPGTFLWKGMIHLDLNNTTLSSDESNWVVTAVHDNSSALSISGSTLNIEINSGAIGTEITTTYQTLVTVRAQITSNTGVAGIDFNEGNMNGKQFYKLDVSPGYASYKNPNIYDVADFVDTYVGRVYAVKYGWTQINGGTVNWADAVNTSVWEGDALVPIANASNLRIHVPAQLTIPTDGELTVIGNTHIKPANGLIVESDNTGTGSLITGTASGSALAQRYMTTDAWHIVASPVSGESISDFLGSNPNVATDDDNFRGMMDYNPTMNDWNSYFINSTPGDLETGKGFSMRTNASSAVTFTGTLHASNLTATNLTSGLWNCIGNPYTSAIGINEASSSITNFLTANASNLYPAFGAIYVWHHTDEFNGIWGEYEIYSNASPGFDVQQGQAFMIRMNTAASSVSFNPKMQIHNPALELKSTKEMWSSIKLQASLNSQKSLTTIAFNKGMTKGLDPTYDAGLLRGGSNLTLYSKLVEDIGIPFAIQALPSDDFSTMVIPIGIESKTGGEVVFTSEIINLPSDCQVILEDKLSKTFTDLSISDYKTMVEANSSVSDRFRIHTSYLTTKLDPEFSSGKLSAYAIRNVEIQVRGEVSKQAVATLYDVQGKVILVRNLDEGSMNIIQTPNIHSGIYMLYVKDNNKSQTFKIPVKE